MRPTTPTITFDPSGLELADKEPASFDIPPDELEFDPSTAPPPPNEGHDCSETLPVEDVSAMFLNPAKQRPCAQAARKHAASLREKSQRASCSKCRDRYLNLARALEYHSDMLRSKTTSDILSFARKRRDALTLLGFDRV